MKKNRIGRWIAAAAALILSSSMVLGVCAAETPADSPESGTEHWADLDVEIENNGGYFVRVDDGETDAVYFRNYGESQLWETAYFGNFVSFARPGETGKLMRYNLETGEVEEVAEDPLTGIIVADGKGFYGRAATDEYGGKICRMSADGKEITELSECRMDLLGSDETGTYVITQYADIFDSAKLGALAVWYDGSEILTAVPDPGELLSYCGFADGQMIFLVYKYETGENRLYSLSVDNGALTSLGRISYRDGDGNIAPLSCRQFLHDEEGIYLMLASERYLYWDGGEPLESPSEIAGHVGIRAVPGKRNSVKVIPEAGEGAPPEETVLPRLLLTDVGEVGVYSRTGGDLELSEGTWGDLIYYDSPFGAWLLAENFIDDPGDSDFRTIVQAMEFVDGAAYIITANAEKFYEEDSDIYYNLKLQQMDWYRIPTGEEAEAAKESEDYEFTHGIKQLAWCYANYEGGLDDDGKGDDEGENSSELLESLLWEYAGGYELVYYREDGGRKIRASRLDGQVLLSFNIYGDVELDWLGESIEMKASVSESGYLTGSVEGENGLIYLTVLSLEGDEMTVQINYPDGDGNYHERMILFRECGVG